MTAADDDGFTLVEMLITLAIVGVVFGLFSSVLGFGRDVLARTTANGAHLDEIALTKRLLTDTLSQVVITDKDGLTGTPRTLATIAYGPPALGLAAPTETIIEPDSDGRGLRATWGTVGQGKIVTRRILDPATESTFSYFRADRGWASGWDVPGTLPDLVRIELRRDSAIATEFIIPVRQLGAPSCITAPAGRCSAVK